ncbi:hypothetical protein MTO96_018412 [Rhipicephalus appendiculatus]
MNEPLPLGLGLLQSVLTEKRSKADLIPVDVVANMLICVAWHTSSKRSKQVKVFHCTSGAVKPQTWGDVVGMAQKNVFVRRYEKVRRAVGVLEYFATHGWLFRTNNVQKLLDELSSTDAKLFNFDVRALEWGHYWKNYILGIRKYLFKAEDSKEPDARKHLRRLYVMHLFFQALLLTFVWRLLRTSTAWNLYSFARMSAKATCQMLLYLLDLLPK